MEHRLNPQTAAPWVDRWESQQKLYATAREERFDVVVDVVSHTVRDDARPLIADLGCGPGALASRLATALPRARVVAVDHDPLLLALGDACHGAGFAFVDAQIGTGPWQEQLTADGPLDAVVSATALHYLEPEALSSVYERVHELLRPGGVLVNADHLFQDDVLVRELAAVVARGHERRSKEPTTGEDWHGWWAAAQECEDFGELLAERRRRALGPGSDNGLSAQQHMELMRKAGFQAVGTVWQYGHSCVLAAVRS